MKPIGKFGIAAMAGALMLSMAACSGTTAAAAPAATPDNVVTVSQNTTGDIMLSENSATAAQLVTFDFSSNFESADVQIVELRNGVNLTQVDAKAAAWSQGGTAAGDASKWFTENTTFYGGLPMKGSNHFRLVMPAKTYYILQLTPVGNLKPSATARTFTVDGSSGVSSPYAPRTLRVVNTNGPDLFLINSVEGPIRADKTTVSNRTGAIPNKVRELHNYKFQQLRAGTTDEQIRAWLTAGGPSPLVNGGGQFGFGVLSPSRYADVTLNMPAGMYVLLSDMRDVNTGKKHSEEGDFLRVTITG